MAFGFRLQTKNLYITLKGIITIMKWGTSLTKELTNKKMGNYAKLSKLDTNAFGCCTKCSTHYA